MSKGGTVDTHAMPECNSAAPSRTRLLSWSLPKRHVVNMSSKDSTLKILVLYVRQHSDSPHYSEQCQCGHGLSNFLF